MSALGSITVECPACGAELEVVLHGHMRPLGVVGSTDARVIITPEFPDHVCPRRPGGGEPLPIPA